MAKHVFTTVGTSAIANHYQSDEYADHEEVVAALQDKRLTQKEVIEEITNGLKHRMALFKRPTSKKKSEKLKLLTAEIASIFAMKQAVKKDEKGKEIKRIGEFEKDDKIILLHSDTVAGKVCAEVTKEVLLKEVKCEIDIKKVEGLRADNAALFLETGMKNLKQVIDDNSREPINYYLNITGGYKGTIPFLTPIAFKFMFTMVYLHEDSDYLIVIPHPVDPSAFELDELIESAWTVLYES